MKGIDISSWQKYLPADVLNSVDFAILKITEGKTWVDPCFDSFYSSAKIPLGAYVYSHATTEEEAAAEARHALSVLDGRKLPLGIYIDIEEKPQLALRDSVLTAVVKAFCDVIRAAGYRPGAYGSAGNLWAKVGPSYLGDDVLVWVASWGSRPKFGDIWQYGCSERLPDYPYALDGDNSLSERFEALVNGSEKPNSSVTPVTPYWPPRTLCYGMVGPDVSVLQAILQARGKQLEITGIFDNHTKSAVLAFQNENGLVADGIPGPLTWGKLLSV